MTEVSWALAALTGLGVGGGLIVAIGAQNAYVLRLGLLRRHVLPVVAFCALSDAALIAAAAAGLGGLIARVPWLQDGAAIAGSVFLIWYGLRAARAAMNPGRLDVAESDGAGTRAQALATVAAFTWLNPHVYLDTVVLLGSLSAQYPPAARTAFALGAMAASLVWFPALGYGARLLAPLFRTPRAWQILDSLIALIMFSIAASLIWPFVRGG
jgi:L-lysine exporter family protein LysE/ArgO